MKKGAKPVARADEIIRPLAGLSKVQPIRAQADKSPLVDIAVRQNQKNDGKNRIECPGLHESGFGVKEMYLVYQVLPVGLTGIVDPDSPLEGLHGTQA